MFDRENTTYSMNTFLVCWQEQMISNFKFVFNLSSVSHNSQEVFIVYSFSNRTQQIAQVYTRQINTKLKLKQTVWGIKEDMSTLSTMEKILQHSVWQILLFLLSPERNEEVITRLGSPRTHDQQLISWNDLRHNLTYR